MEQEGRAADLAPPDEQTAYQRDFHDLVARYNGSISADHGIGSLKREKLAHYKSPVALAMMRSIKTALDPQNLMNPGRMLAA